MHRGLLQDFMLVFTRLAPGRPKVDDHRFSRSSSRVIFSPVSVCSSKSGAGLPFNINGTAWGSLPKLRRGPETRCRHHNADADYFPIHVASAPATTASPCRLRLGHREIRDPNIIIGMPTTTKEPSASGRPSQPLGYHLFQTRAGSNKRRFAPGFEHPAFHGFTLTLIVIQRWSKLPSRIIAMVMHQSWPSH